MSDKNIKKTLKDLVIELPELYQPIYKHKELYKSPSRDSEDRLNYLIEVYKALSFKMQRRLRVLDLGCAQGFFSMSLSEAGAIVHGVDYGVENIAVCKKLAKENKNLDVSFQLGHIEEFISQLETAEYDLVLGLSVFHHIVHEQGSVVVRELLDRAAKYSAALVVEFALPEEPLYWSSAQPENPRSLLDGCAFVHELARHDTHLAPIPRPLYFASNNYWVLNGLAGQFDSWTTEPHALCQGAHKGSRRYYFNDEYIIKLFRFDHSQGSFNKNELKQEIQFLTKPPKNFLVPSCLTSGVNDTEGWVVVRRKPGKLLLDTLCESTKIDHITIVRTVLEELVILEAAGLYHNDVRAWNVLLDDNGIASLIDYGSISPLAQDCAWPENIFLAFFIFVNELTSGVVEHPGPLRTVSIGPYNLPQPYCSWASALWKQPLQKWSFKLMRDLLDTTNANHSDELDRPQDAWAKAIENAIQIQSKLIHHQNLLFEQVETKARQAETKAEQVEAELIVIQSSISWRLTAPLRFANKIARKLLSRWSR